MLRISTAISTSAGVVMGFATPMSVLLFLRFLVVAWSGSSSIIRTFSLAAAPEVMRGATAQVTKMTAMVLLSMRSSNISRR